MDQPKDAMIEIQFGLGPTVRLTPNQHHHRRASLECLLKAGDRIGHALIDVNHGNADLAGDPGIPISRSDRCAFMASGDDTEARFLAFVEQLSLGGSGQSKNRLYAETFKNTAHGGCACEAIGGRAHYSSKNTSSFSMLGAGCENHEITFALCRAHITIPEEFLLASCSRYGRWVVPRRQIR
jgi:hypothetical protein